VSSSVLFVCKCVLYCTVLLPPGGYPIAVNKYIISYRKGSALLSINLPSKIPRDSMILAQRKDSYITSLCECNEPVYESQVCKIQYPPYFPFELNFSVHK